MAILRFPVVAFAYLVDKLRRVPGMGWVQHHVPAVVATLLALAALCFLYWGAQRSPQRMDMLGLVNGQLSTMQSWIIISGDLERDPLYPAELRYILTDADVPDAKLVVTSDNELATGKATISGTIVGGRLPPPTGERWTGQMVADDELATEQDPPWIALGFVIAALLVSGAARSSYPVLFDERPKPTTTGARTIKVGVVRGPRTERGQRVSGTLGLTPGAPPELHVYGDAPTVLRLHSPHTSVDIGELRGLSGSEAALVVHLATEEMVLTFDSREDRDVTFAALAAEFEPRRDYPSPSGPVLPGGAAR